MQIHYFQRYHSKENVDTSNTCLLYTSANDILYSDKVNGKQKQRLTFFLQKSKKLIEHYEYNTQRQCVADMRSFVRFYEFLLQVSSFEDTDLHKKYNFVSYLLAYINIKHPGGGFNLDGKIKATNFVQKKGEEHFMILKGKYKKV